MFVFYFLSVVFSSALSIVAFLLISSGDLSTFKERYARKRLHRSTHLPIVTSHGDIVNSLEDLDVQLEVLKSQLTDKQNMLEESKTKVASAASNLQRLHDTSCEVKRYYIRLKAEIAKSDMDCKELQKQIEEYRKTQNKLRDEVNANIKHYHCLINDVTPRSSRQEFEFLAKLPLTGKLHLYNLYKGF